MSTYNRVFEKIHFSLLFSLWLIYVHFTKNTNGDESSNTLQHLSVIFRHGNRAPIADAIFDRNHTYKWPGELGQLTDKGKRRMVELGNWFRSRYGHFISNKFDNAEVKIHSSDVDRTIMSAQCFSFGLYPVNISNSWYKNEEWQPIPVHTISRETDRIIGNILKYRFPQQKTNFSEQDFKTIDIIGSENGVSYREKNASQLGYELRRIVENIEIFKEYNVSLPAWVDRVYPEPLKTIALSNLERLKFTIKQKSEQAGHLVKSLLLDMTDKISNKTSKQKVHIYSGHDTTISRVLKAFDINTGERTFPYYGTLLVLELHKNGSEYLVNILYKNDAVTTLLNIPDCGINCSLKTFEELARPMTVEEAIDVNVCPSSSHPIDSYPFAIGILTVFSLIIFDVVRI